VGQNVAQRINLAVPEVQKGQVSIRGARKEDKEKGMYMVRMEKREIIMCCCDLFFKTKINTNYYGTNCR